MWRRLLALTASLALVVSTAALAEDAATAGPVRKLQLRLLGRLHTRRLQVGRLALKLGQRRGGKAKRSGRGGALQRRLLLAFSLSLQGGRLGLRLSLCMWADG